MTDPFGSLLPMMTGMQFSGRLTIDPVTRIVSIGLTMPALRVQIVPCSALGTSAVTEPTALGVYSHVHDESVYIGQGPVGTRPQVSNAKHYGAQPGMTILGTRVGQHSFTTDEATFLESCLIEGARRARVPRRNAQVPASPERLQGAQVDRVEMALMSTVLMALLEALMPRRGDDPEPRQVDQMVRIVEESDVPLTQAQVAAEMGRRDWPVGMGATSIVARNLRDYVLPSPLATLEATDLGVEGRTFYAVKGRTYSPDAIARALCSAPVLTEAGEAA